MFQVHLSEWNDVPCARHAVNLYLYALERKSITFYDGDVYPLLLLDSVLYHVVQNQESVSVETRTNVLDLCTYLLDKMEPNLALFRRASGSVSFHSIRGRID